MLAYCVFHVVAARNFLENCVAFGASTRLAMLGIVHLIPRKFSLSLAAGHIRVSQLHAEGADRVFTLAALHLL